MLHTHTVKLEVTLIFKVGCSLPFGRSHPTSGCCLENSELVLN